jgi:tetratricopeptide (TPR) repeat protein
VNPADDDSIEADFASLMAACDDALANEATVDDVDAAAVPPAQRERLARDLECVRLLQQLRPHHPPGNAAGPTSPSSIPCPMQLGRFRILRELGRGGFGVVYRAYDEELGREVALKVPRAETLASPELRERFQREARAAAGLDHPNLVPVYDAGVVGPFCYIAFAYCPGTNLSAWLKQRTEPVPYPQVAALAATLADAVQHAHDRGVLHRDLKPANVLLTPAAEAPASGVGPNAAVAGLGLVPRVTDFGLAKLVGGASGQTQSGQVLGTPSYMAPEQAAGKAREIGPVTDVYALGAILYELLTGRPPFQAETPLDTLRQVQTDEPVPPARLRPRLPRDLETICLKCLEKSPSRRYARAGLLGDDLRRYAAGQPVRARPVGVVGRLWRRCRRHPGVASLLATLFVVVLSGLAAVVWQWREAVGQRDQAEKNFQKVRQVVDRFFTQFSEIELLNEPGLQPLRKKILGDALVHYQELFQQRGSDPAVRSSLAIAYLRLAIITSELGGTAEALSLCQEAVRLQEELLRSNPDVRKYQGSFLQICNVLGGLQLEGVQTEEALRTFRKAFAACDRMLRVAPDDPEEGRWSGILYHNLGLTLNLLGRHGEAGPALRQAAERQRGVLRRWPDIFASRRALGDHLNALAAFHHDRGEVTDALRYAQEGLEIREALVREVPNSISLRYDLARCWIKLGSLKTATGRTDEALRSLGRSRDLLEPLAQANPAVVEVRRFLGQTYSELGRACVEARRPEEARRWLETSRTLHQQLVEAQPNNSRFRGELAKAHFLLGIVHLGTGDVNAALGSFQTARHLQEQLLRGPADGNDHPYRLAATLNLLSVLHLKRNQPLLALECVQSAQEISERLVRADPGNARLCSQLGSVLHNLAFLFELQGRYQEAEKICRQAIVHQRLAYREAPQVPEFRLFLCKHYDSLLVLQQSRLGPPADALATRLEWRAFLQQVVRDHPKDLDMRSRLGAESDVLGLALLRQGRNEQALEAFQSAVEHQRIAFDKMPEQARFRQLLSKHLHNLAFLQRKLNRPAAAAAATRERQKLWPDDPVELRWVAGAFAHCIPLVGRGKTDLSEEEQSERRGYGDEAVAALRQAVARGYKDSRHLEKAPDLEPLRARADFQQLLSEVRAQAPSKSQ